MLLKVKYLSRIFSSGCWMEIDRRCWVEIISTQHQAFLWRIDNSLIRPLQQLCFRYMFLFGFSSISTYTKTSQSHYQLLTAGSHSSLTAGGHVGCWVEIHPASLSEGWDGHQQSHWFAWKWVHIIHEAEFQLAAPSLCWEMVENADSLSVS